MLMSLDVVAERVLISYSLVLVRELWSMAPKIDQVRSAVRVAVEEVSEVARLVRMSFDGLPLVDGGGMSRETVERNGLDGGGRLALVLSAGKTMFGE